MLAGSAPTFLTGAAVFAGSTAAASNPDLAVTEATAAIVFSCSGTGFAAAAGCVAVASTTVACCSLTGDAGIVAVTAGVPEVTLVVDTATERAPEIMIVDVVVTGVVVAGAEFTEEAEVTAGDADIEDTDECDNFCLLNKYNQYQYFKSNKKYIKI